MDDLAKDIGVQPNLLWLFLTDFPLFKKVLWGPVTAYQYRLMGPGKWEGARKAIFTQYDRMYQPLKTRQVWKKRLFCILWVLLYANQRCILIIFSYVSSSWMHNRVQRQVSWSSLAWHSWLEELQSTTSTATQPPFPPSCPSCVHNQCDWMRNPAPVSHLAPPLILRVSK